MRLALFPPPLPPRDSEEEALLLSALVEHCNKIPLVRSLRADKEHWREWDAYAGIPEGKAREGRLTTGPMAGFKGLGLQVRSCLLLKWKSELNCLPVQKVFHNSEENRAVSVVFFGGGLTGWPGVTHGGAIATVLDESLGRVAIRANPAKTGVTANLQVSYRKPITANQLYVVRAELVPDESTDRKLKVKGHVEDLKGEVRVEAEGLFVVPKNIKLAPMIEDF